MSSNLKGMIWKHGVRISKVKWRLCMLRCEKSIPNLDWNLWFSIHLQRTRSWLKTTCERLYFPKMAKTISVILHVTFSIQRWVDFPTCSVPSPQLLSPTLLTAGCSFVTVWWNGALWHQRLGHIGHCSFYTHVGILALGSSLPPAREVQAT